MSKINRISKLTLVAVVGLVLLASVGAYAYWSVQTNIDNNKIKSGSMTMTVVDLGQSAVTPIGLNGIMPGDGGRAKVWDVQVGACPTSGDDLSVRISNIKDSVSLADNVQIGILLLTAGADAYWLNADGTTTAYVYGTDPETDYVNHVFNLSLYEGKIWKGMAGFTGLKTGDDRHINVYYKLPLNCASDCHDDEASFDLAVELEQNHG